jgi:hypothetical protein
VLYTFARPSYSSHTTPSIARDVTIISKMGHTIVMGLPMVRVRRQNPPVGLEPPRAIRARDEVTQRVDRSWHIQSPIEGTQHSQASYLSLNWEVSFTPLHVGWHRVIRVFPSGITQERRMKPPSLDLTGGISPCLILWRGICSG